MLGNNGTTFRSSRLSNNRLVELSTMHKYNNSNDGENYAAAYNNTSALSKQPFRVYSNEEELEATVSLRVIAGDDIYPHRHIRLPCLIGRKDSSTNIQPCATNLIFHSPFLSRKHAELVSIGNGGVAIRDTGSSNGTFLNGVAIAPMKLVRLSEGDLIQFGTEDANQDSVVICQFSITSSSNSIPATQPPPQSISTTKLGKNSICSTTSSSVGPMSKIADISRKLASLGIILNNAEDADMNAKLIDTLETVEQLLESLEVPTEERKTFAEETIHTRPLIGTAMRIINVYEAIFCVLAASLLLLVIIFH